MIRQWLGNVEYVVIKTKFLAIFLIKASAALVVYPPTAHSAWQVSSV